MESNFENDTYLNFDKENEVKLGETFSINYKNILGNGSFGVIYLGYDNRTNSEVAIKMEHQNAKNPQLINESKILKLLQGGGNYKIYQIIMIIFIYIIIMLYL
jgi:predicted Ser/Thr protein kinase